MAKFFQISIQILNMDFFQLFPFPSGSMSIIFKILKTKNSIQISKTLFFKTSHFKFFLWHNQKNFLGPKLPYLLKD
jgi:hypothetical protein